MKQLKQLQTPVIRDVIDKGMGNAAVKPTAVIENNAFPIFEASRNTAASASLSVRYMRFWIEKGYMKCNVDMAPDLVQALDALDRVMKEDVERVPIVLERGQMAFCNNHTILHQRNAYTDVVGREKRRMVRVWIDL
jgi:hypothetical protein